VEDVMADLATVFGWPPQAMNPMPLPELMRWHERAIERAKAQAGPPPAT
jgi:hypothetical protein